MRKPFSLGPEDAVEDSFGLVSFNIVTLCNGFKRVQCTNIFQDKRRVCVSQMAGGKIFRLSHVQLTWEGTRQVGPAGDGGEKEGVGVCLGVCVTEMSSTFAHTPIVKR